MENPYIQVLIQWLMLFGLLSIILLPAIMFRKIAVRSNRKGWVFFLVGMGIGLTSLQAARGLAVLLMKYEILTQNGGYLHSLILFCAVLTLVSPAHDFLKKEFSLLHNPPRRAEYHCRRSQFIMLVKAADDSLHLSKPISICQTLF